MTPKEKTIFFLRRHIRHIVDSIQSHQAAKQNMGITPSAYVMHDDKIGELKEELELMKQLIRDLEKV